MSMRIHLLRFSAVLLISNSLAAYAPALAEAHFEVASIKHGNPALGAFSSTSTGPPGGQFRITNLPLKDWILLALRKSSYAVVCPEAAVSSRYDLVARLPAEGQGGSQAISEMLTSLLTERFSMKWHHEIRNISGYRLVKDHVKVKPISIVASALEGHGVSTGPGFIGLDNQPISELIRLLSDTTGHPVVDETGMVGNFDIKLRWIPADDAAVAEARRYGTNIDSLPSSVNGALQDKLGLHLESYKVPADVVVIDAIASQPSEN